MFQETHWRSASADRFVWNSLQNGRHLKKPNNSISATFRPKYSRVVMVCSYVLSSVLVSFCIYSLLSGTKLEFHWESLGGFGTLAICLVNMQASFLYWEFESTGLAEHYFWRKNVLPYASIVSVSAKRGQWLQIETNDDRAPLRVNPRHSNEFLLTLRQHALHADFQVISDTK
jgi:hypothetical protein